MLALKIVFIIFIALNLHLYSNGDNAQNHARKTRNIETFIYREMSELQNGPNRQYLSTIGNNIKNFMDFSLAVIRSTGQDILDQLEKIGRVAFGGGEYNNIKSKMLVKKL